MEPCIYVQNIKDDPHLNLRGVSFIGFEGREVDVEFLKDLLENAVRLEKMILVNHILREVQCVVRGMRNQAHQIIIEK